MGEIKSMHSVLLIVAAFSQRETSLAWGRHRCEERFGPVAMESEDFSVDAFTNYYTKSMGPGLLKRFWAFSHLIDPGSLAEVKCYTNALEDEYAADPANCTKIPVARPLNLDPGYIDLGKLILASTKDHAHRIYLRDGIFAETTLMYTQKRWQALAWTYPDYQSEGYQRFFDACRDFLKRKQPGG